MIDPNNIINHNRTTAELEELILFLVVVAGKKATTMARELDKFLNKDIQYTGRFPNPFDRIKWMLNRGVLGVYVRQVGFGQYNRVSRAFTQLANSNLDLRTCTIDELQEIHGVGRKSASCFLAWSRPNQRLAMLDVHLLRELKEIGIPNVPLATPSSRKEYDRLENAWLGYCDENGLNPTSYDLEVWARRAARA